MKLNRYSTTRQKSCTACSLAKAKCDRGVGCCTRCSQRGLSCTYPQAPPSDSVPSLAAANDHDEIALEGPSSASPANAILSPEGKYQDVLDFSNLELFCPINADSISNRWLNSYLAIPGQKAKNYPPSITALIRRILKSYVDAAVRGRGVPPFLHSSQTMTTYAQAPLSTCLTLIRIFEKPLPGGETATMKALQRALDALYEEYETYDDMTQLAAFQACLMYSMIVFVKVGQVSVPFFRQTIVELQKLACCSSRQGLMCIAEQQRTRPTWESWIVVESKRRAVFTMYLFDSLLSAQDGLPTMLGTELQGLPAPASRMLWRAQTRGEWEAEYNIHLVDWPDGDFRIDELWPTPADLDEAGILDRRVRSERWLESVDEFGTFMYAVTSCTHAT
ncbi:hypothetical protein B0J13DRAFT_625525 [Dactylonectria estremocensis]|uniref:Zn(2)-C6 fungal-type domain-containing protein n=1 Tax=Dactylonectria estremocensis TaxID=1079267 RepID=A0A9P9IYI5_9HYPO|nr:hypothetical protein B0J13DRAFT_625525 [Dactylonectria estremocensis]